MKNNSLTVSNIDDDKKIINSDIYNISDSINRLAKQFIPELTEDTMNVGLPGYIIGIETMKMKNTAMMTGMLSNEVFPSRALLDKNIITHAIMQGISHINATPSRMTIVMGILVSDFMKYATFEATNNTGTFIFDKFCPINIEGDYEFHIDYDIILQRSRTSNGQYVYTAYYNLPTNDAEYNRISNIDNPYIKQPFVIKIGESDYILLQTVVHQVSIERRYTTFITSSVVDNRTLVFEFDNSEQLADFEVIVTEHRSDKKVYLTPVFEGSALKSNINKYCEYTYINTNTIRINFVRASYMPSLNSKVELIIKTTKGSKGIFKYNQPTFITYHSSDYGYPTGINILIRPNTNSTGGIDRKSTKELHNILPKEILMNGAITTETDLTNYFNLINTDKEKMLMMKKSDSQIERIYYAYMVIKNNMGNVVPTNTIPLFIDENYLNTSNSQDSKTLQCGSIIEYNSDTGIGKIIRDAEASKSAYVYMTLYTIMINRDPLYASYFLTLINEDPYVIYRWINTDSIVQFMMDNVHFERKLTINPNQYNLTLTAIQSINDAEDMYIVDKESGEEINNMKCFIVLYKNKIPYRFMEGELLTADLVNYKFEWGFTFYSDNTYDSHNNIKINGLKVPGTNTELYCFLEQYVESYIYILAKSPIIGTDNRYDLDKIVNNNSGVPILDGYGVTNKFEIHGGLHFYTDFSGILNSRIVAATKEGDVTSNNYNLSGVPVVGYKYMMDEEYGEDRILEFLDILEEKKSYMDNALVLLENSFDIDYKFYNTYGPSYTYSIDDDGERKGHTKILEHSIGRIDISLRFRLSLKSSSDIYTKDNIISYVKDYIENLNNTNTDLDISNMMSDIRVHFNNVINYIDYIGFNNYDSNTHHMYYQNPHRINIPPEFINVYIKRNEVGELVPNIDIEVVD